MFRHLSNGDAFICNSATPIQEILQVSRVSIDVNKQLRMQRVRSS